MLRPDKSLRRKDFMQPETAGTTAHFIWGTGGPEFKSRRSDQSNHPRSGSSGATRKPVFMLGMRAMPVSWRCGAVGLEAAHVRPINRNAPCDDARSHRTMREDDEA
jgi:hypothetical protein